MNEPRLEIFAKRGPLALKADAWGKEFALVLAAGEPPPPFVIENGKAIVEIAGPLVYRAGTRWDSYEAIQARTSAAFESEAPEIVLRMNTPGGDVDGMFDLSRWLRHESDEHGKKVTAFVDGICASAGVCLAVSADEIVIAETAFIGSIGIIEAMAEQTALDASMGVRFAIISSGARKADGNPHLPISDGARAALQGHVDDLAQLFFAHVADMRGLSAEKVEGFQAAMFLGAKSIGTGLADQVSTWSELIGRAAEITKPSRSSKSMAKAMSYAEAVKAAAKMLDDVEGDDDDKKKAKSAAESLRAGKHGEAKAEGDGEEKKDEKEGKKAEGDEKKPDAKKAEAEGSKAKAEEQNPDRDKEAKAKAEAEGDEKKDEGKKASAGATVHSLAERVHRLEAEKAQKADEELRASLLAKRPDFSAEVAATLREGPIEMLKKAVETWPRIPGKLGAQALAGGAHGTRGSSQTGDPADAASTDPEATSYIKGKMGRVPQGSGIERSGTGLTLGFMSPEAATNFLKKKGAAGAQEGK